MLEPSRAVSLSGPPELAALVANHSWFAVFVRSHHEKRISQHCLQRDIESFLPLYSEVHTWANRCKATVELPLFPNYLFVRIRSAVRRRVLDVPGVLSIVSRGSQIAPLPDAEIESLRSGLRLGKLGPHPHLAVGERVRITAGPLNGMEGILLRKKNHLRVVITISQIAQSVAVEVDAAEIESLDASPREHRSSDF
jgi:transcription antitermination factor NusG